MRRGVRANTFSRPSVVRPQRSPARSRRGVSMIETMVVITTMSVVGTMSIATMFLMLRAEGSGAKSLVASTSFSRLSRDFRRDVHAAIAARHVEAGPDQREQLELIPPDKQTITYTIHADRIARTTHRDGKQRTTESYALADGDSHFEYDPETPLIVLVHLRRGETFSGTDYDGAPVRAYRIEAVRGRDHRFHPVAPNDDAANPSAQGPMKDEARSSMTPNHPPAASAEDVQPTDAETIEPEDRP